MELVAAVRGQAKACAALGSPMYAELLDRVADDIEAGGPAAVVLAGHENDPGPSAVALRLAGSVHRLVLERRAGELAAYYPSVGGRWDVDAGWPAFRRLLAEQPDAVREWLDRPPQTNEVGRATGLMGGLLEVAARRPLSVRLFEIGSSGGLNLLADRFCYRAEGRSCGDPDSPVVLEPAWTEELPPLHAAVAVVERVGGDVLPVDVSTPEGRLVLTAYVWPDQAHRLARLRGAFELASRVAFELRRQSAGDLVAGLSLRPGTTTVLWHSVMWQYLDEAEKARVGGEVERLGAAASTDAPFAHLTLEQTRRAPGMRHEFLVVLRLWPGGERRILGTSVGHGVPTRWGS